MKIFLAQCNNTSFPLHIITLQETHINPSADIQYFELPGYNLVYDLARINSFRGVAMYVHDSFSFTRLDIDTFKQDSSVYESLYLEIYNKDARFHKYVIGSVYIRPSDLLDDLTQFIEEFSEILSNIHAVSRQAYVNGDYNIDLLQLHTNTHYNAFYENITAHGFFSKITRPTRSFGNSHTLIDNVFTTNLNSDLSAYILDIHISDHQPVVLFTNDDIPPTRSKFITIRANTDDRKDNFRQCFHNKYIFDQLDKDIHVTDPNYNYEILEHAIKYTHSECFPERRVRFNAKKHKKTPWITNGILKSTNNRNKLYKKLKQSRIDSINYIAKKTDFNKYRNTLSKTITNAKRVYYNQIFDRYKYDMKKTWNIISEPLNRKVKNPIPETMTINGQDCSDKGTIAESFNTFFASIGKQNELNIRTHQGSHFGDYLTGDNNCKFAFHLIDNTTTLRIIKNTKSSTNKDRYFF